MPTSQLREALDFAGRGGCLSPFSAPALKRFSKLRQCSVAVQPGTLVGHSASRSSSPPARRSQEYPLPPGSALPSPRVQAAPSTLTALLTARPSPSEHFHPERRPPTPCPSLVASPSLFAPLPSMADLPITPEGQRDKYIGLALAISSSLAIGTSFIITKKARGGVPLVRPGSSRLTRQDGCRVSLMRRIGTMGLRRIRART